MSDFEDHSDARTVCVNLASYDGRGGHYLSLLPSPPFILSVYHQTRSLHRLQVPLPRQGRTSFHNFTTSFLASYRVPHGLADTSALILQRQTPGKVEVQFTALALFNHPHAVLNPFDFSDFLQKVNLRVY